MPYCNGEKKARIIYSFNGKERTFETEVTPLEVSTNLKRINASENYRSTGYEITFYSPNNRAQLNNVVRDYIIFPSSGTSIYGENYAGISVWTCSGTDFPRDSNGNYTGVGIDVTTLQIVPNGRTCPDVLSNRCNIQISSNARVIFQDQGECPVIFRVECGDCPQGYKRVEIPEYPGYKCLAQCPPESICQCDCGDVICCYGSQGQVLKTIPK